MLHVCGHTHLPTAAHTQPSPQACPPPGPCVPGLAGHSDSSHHLCFELVACFPNLLLVARTGAGPLPVPPMGWPRVRPEAARKHSGEMLVPRQASPWPNTGTGLSPVLAAARVHCRRAARSLGLPVWPRLKGPPDPERTSGRPRGASGPAWPLPSAPPRFFPLHRPPLAGTGATGAGQDGPPQGGRKPLFLGTAVLGAEPSPRDPDPPVACRGQHAPQRQAGDRRGRGDSGADGRAKTLGQSPGASLHVHTQEGVA